MGNYVKWASSRCHNWKSPRCRRIRRLDTCRELDLDRSRFNDLVLKCNDYMATTKEIAWAAGLVEGEECIVAGVFGHKCTKQIRLVVEMSDYDVIKRLADIFHVTAIRHKAGRSAKHHDTYVFSLTGVRLRGWLMTIYVFLGE